MIKYFENKKTMNFEFKWVYGELELINEKRMFQDSKVR